jgi:predicted nucleotidyltransferase
MRITNTEVKAIKSIFLEVYQHGQIILFGSRVDDKKKGGDIDLFIKSEGEQTLDQKITFLAKLKERIGDQKIDVIVSKDVNRLIEQEAMKTGIIL